ncbi:MAG: hypothetical protein IJ081_04410 [Prevotella sp.]|nr:hypothetical protein [Prevotella sp.]
MRKLKLLLAACALMMGWSSASAQTDVTNTYLTNANFSSGDPIDGNVFGYTGDAGGGYAHQQAVTGWTIASTDVDGKGSAVFAYGSSYQLKGNNVSGPATDPDGNSGNALGMFAVWGNTVQYTQDITLPAGCYTLTFPVYNVTGTTILGNSGNLFGFIPDEGDAYYCANNTFAIGQWTVMSVSFKLTASTSGKISVGYVSPGGGSGANPMLYLDKVVITEGNDYADYTANVNLTGWTATTKIGTYNVNVTTVDSRSEKMQEDYGTVTKGDALTQTVTVPNGTYNVVVFATSQMAWGATSMSTDAGDAAYVYINDGEYTIKTFLNARVSNSYTTPGVYSINNLTVTDGQLKIGLAVNTASTTNWHTIQIKSLTRINVDLSDLINEYNTVKATADAFTEGSMFADAWTALQNAISDNTLDVSAPGLTKAELDAAIANLTAANNAATAAVTAKTTYNTAVTTINGGTNVDVTSLIVNPSFESNFTGWTNVGMAAQGNTSFTKTGSKYAECWEPNGTKSVSQTVGALPAGIYILQLRAKDRSVTSAKLFANGNEQAITIEDKENEYNLTFEIADKASINIGFEGVGTGAGASWLAFDNFRLTYVGTVDDLTYTKASGKMGTDKSAAQDDAETTFLAEKNLTNYNALIAAIAEAEASVANYAVLKAAIDKAVAVKAANNFVTADATTALQNEIDDATTGWTNVTYTDAGATAEIAALGSAVSGWHAIDNNGKAGSFMASAWGKTSENWWNAPYINTWSTEGDNDGSGFSVPFFEYYTGDTENLAANSFTATLTGLDNGYYEVELWARVQRRSDADFNANGSMITMSVNGGTAVSIMDNTSNNVGSGTSVMRLGRYTARGFVTDGTLTLTINVVLGSNVHWLCWRDVNYTKLVAEDVAINEGVNYTPAEKYANVTLTRTLSNTNWNTFCVPFDIDNATLAAKFGTVVVAEFSEASVDPANATVNFTKMATPAISANVPVLLKTSTAPASVTFNGVVIKTGDAKVAGTNFDFVGSYDASTYVTTGNYYLSANKLYKSAKDNGTFIKGTRAFIEAKTAGARIANFFIDDETTGINVIEATNNSNNALYNLNGQKINNAKKGVFIQNGKKVVLK